jgi:hypothetical protein
MERLEERWIRRGSCEPAPGVRAVCAEPGSPDAAGRAGAVASSARGRTGVRLRGLAARSRRVLAGRRALAASPESVQVPGGDRALRGIRRGREASEEVARSRARRVRRARGRSIGPDAAQRRRDVGSPAVLESAPSGRVVVEPGGRSTERAAGSRSGEAGEEGANERGPSIRPSIPPESRVARISDDRTASSFVLSEPRCTSGSCPGRDSRGSGRARSVRSPATVCGLSSRRTEAPQALFRGVSAAIQPSSRRTNRGRSS